MSHKRLAATTAADYANRDRLSSVATRNSQQEAEDIFVVALTIAQADGEVDEKEQAVMVQIARELGINPRDYGLAA